jgi:hypothetical protein
MRWKSLRALEDKQLTPLLAFVCIEGRSICDHKGAIRVPVLRILPVAYIVFSLPH